MEAMPEGMDLLNNKHPKGLCQVHNCQGPLLLLGNRQVRFPPHVLLVQAGSALHLNFLVPGIFASHKISVLSFRSGLSLSSSFLPKTLPLAGSGEYLSEWPRALSPKGTMFPTA